MIRLIASRALGAAVPGGRTRATGSERSDARTMLEPPNLARSIVSDLPQAEPRTLGPRQIAWLRYRMVAFADCMDMTKNMRVKP